MRFHKTGLDGAYVIGPTPHVDHRGFFGRIWCHDELTAQGLVAEIAQSNVGFRHREETLLGLHLQHAPHAEVKTVTLRDDSEMHYHTSKVYHPASATGVNYDDPAFGIEWPGEITVASDQDRAWPDFAARELSFHGTTG